MKLNFATLNYTPIGASATYTRHHNTLITSLPDPEMMLAVI